MSQNKDRFSLGPLGSTEWDIITAFCGDVPFRSPERLQEFLKFTAKPALRDTWLVPGLPFFGRRAAEPLGADLETGVQVFCDTAQFYVGTMAVARRFASFPCTPQLTDTEGGIQGRQLSKFDLVYRDMQNANALGAKLQREAEPFCVLVENAHLALRIGSSTLEHVAYAGAGLVHALASKTVDLATPDVEENYEILPV